ncbi:MAG: PAS domain S-box protein [Ferruginibacter sp.]
MINTLGFFESIFKNAKENSVIMMDQKGSIIEVNRSFLSAFGYRQSQLVGKNFSMLFTAKDRKANKPALEIKTAVAKGSKSDNNYLVHKDGTPIWVIGESVAVKNTEGEKYIVKIIQNINSHKKLERFLMESNDFLDTVFDSVKDAAFVILNSEMRILRSNKIFTRIFGLQDTPVSQVKIFKLENSFWKNTDLRKQLTDIMVLKKQMKDVPFLYTNAAGKEKNLEISSKTMDSEETGRSILLVIRIL